MPKRTNEFQELITTIYKQITLDGANVTESGMVYDKDTKTLREVDILIEYRYAHHDITMIIECRDRSRKDSVEWIDGLIGKTHSLDINKIVAVSKKGFTKTAESKAKKYGIDTLTLKEAVDTDWKSYPIRPGIMLFSDEKCQLVDVLYKKKGRYLSVKELGLDSMVSMDGKQLATIKETFEYFLDKYFKPQIQKKVSQNALGIFKNVAGLSKTLYAESEFKLQGLKVQLPDCNEVDISNVKIIVNSTRKIFNVNPTHYKFNDLMVSTGKHSDVDGSQINFNVVQDAEAKKIHVKWKKEGLKNRAYYLKLRDKYHPQKIKVVFVLESPPVSGKYFYDKTGKTSEPLFYAMMKLLDYNPTDKNDGLKFFKSKGYLLVDATYKQVNRLTGNERNTAILSDFNDLVDDLERICPKKEIPIILVKANICRLLEERLTAKGFKVINNVAIIPFPSHGHQNRFHSETSKILQEYYL